MLLNKLMDLIKELIDKKWYGKIELSFESGNIVNIKKTESIKLEEKKIMGSIPKLPSYHGKIKLFNE